MEARLNLQADGTAEMNHLVLRLDPGGARVEKSELVGPQAAATAGVACAFQRILEVRVDLATLGAERGTPLRFQFSLWQNGLPMDAIPQQGWITIPTGAPGDWET